LVHDLLHELVGEVRAYVGEQLVLSRAFSSDPSTDSLLVTADDASIAADGSDATRVAFCAVTHSAPRPHVQGNVTITIDGPGVLIGDATFDFKTAGGAGAIWIRSQPGTPGTIAVTVSHAVLGSKTVVVTAS
jgi:beta-galactosidase